MVKLSQAGKDAITRAIGKAERLTDAEIVAVVSPASDAYQSYMLLYGLLLGSAVAIGLWVTKLLTVFPLLLAIQLGVVALLALTPLCRACLRLVPKRIVHARAAHRAYEEYLTVLRHVPASVPILVFYVSLAEHYAHILPSRAVREKIPDKEWDAIIDAFTASMKTKRIDEACIDVIQRMAALLIPHFPSHGETQYLSNEVIET